MSLRNDDNRRGDSRRNDRGDTRRNDVSEGRRGPNNNNNNNNNVQRNNNSTVQRNNGPREERPQTDRTVDALVALARSLLNGRQLGELSERLASRRPAPFQDATRSAPSGERRGRGRGAANTSGIPVPNSGRGGRGGRGARGGRSEEGTTRPATAPSGDARPRRNNRRPNIGSQ